MTNAPQTPKNRSDTALLMRSGLHIFGHRLCRRLVNLMPETLKLTINKPLVAELKTWINDFI
jgi:hypothetical protein